jgi:hypothetical protein
MGGRQNLIISILSTYFMCYGYQHLYSVWHENRGKIVYTEKMRGCIKVGRNGGSMIMVLTV